MKQNMLTYLGLCAEESMERERSLVNDADRSYTMGEVWDKARRGAASILDWGLCQKPVCVEAEQRPETLVLFLGILLSGNYYIPLSPELLEEKEKKS